ncbi:hypothetical protein ACFQV8_01835 [Pseudonocardia benzenivorans]
MSQVAWQGISSAIDHLDSFMDLLDGGKAHPLSPGTLARSGILGAAHALWVLDVPDREERQRRGLRLAHEDFKREQQLVTDMRDLMGDPTGTGQERIDILTEWMGRAVTVGTTTLNMTPAAVRRFTDTALIDEVAARYAEAVPDSGDIAVSYRMVWRIYSGSAHGLRWSAMLNAAIERNADGPGGNAYVTKDLSDLAMAASAVAIFAHRAIELYDEQRTP